MNEDFNSRAWAEHGRAFSTAIVRLFAEVGIGLRRLNQIEFDAPWRSRAEKRRAGPC